MNRQIMAESTIVPLGAGSICLMIGEIEGHRSLAARPFIVFSRQVVLSALRLFLWSIVPSRPDKSKRFDKARRLFRGKPSKKKSKMIGLL
jgi:hypothetical protein